MGNKDAEDGAPFGSGVEAGVKTEVLSNREEGVVLAAVRYIEPETERFPILAWTATSKGSVRASSVVTVLTSAQLDMLGTEPKARPNTKLMVNRSGISIVVARFYRADRT